MIKKILVVVILFMIFLVGCRLDSEPSLKGEIDEEPVSDERVIDLSTEKEVGNVTGDINGINAELEKDLAELDSLEDLDFEL